MNFSELCLFGIGVVWAEIWNENFLTAWCMISKMGKTTTVLEWQLEMNELPLSMIEIQHKNNPSKIRSLCRKIEKVESWEIFCFEPPSQSCHCIITANDALAQKSHFHSHKCCATTCCAMAGSLCHGRVPTASLVTCMQITLKKKTSFWLVVSTG